MSNQCKNATRRRRLRASVIAMLAIVAALTSCSTDEAYSMDEAPLKHDVIARVAYDGEWTVNSQVVDTARLVVIDENMRIRLPESYLLGLCSSSASEATPTNAPIVIQTVMQGYSKLSNYNSFASEAKNDANNGMRFSTCSFMATIGGESCKVSIVSAENATAVWQKDTDQWTLAIPIDAIIVDHAATGQLTEHTLASTITLYYHTKKRTE